MRSIFFDRDGDATLWVLRNGRLVDADGNSIGYIDSDSVYDYNGSHRGWYEEGFIRDHDGACVCFLKGATGLSPILPITSIPPIPGIPEIEPIRPIKEIKPVKPIKQIAWSQYDPITLFRI